MADGVEIESSKSCTITVTNGWVKMSPAIDLCIIQSIKKMFNWCARRGEI